MSVDYESLVVFTRTAFHLPSCNYLNLAKTTTTEPIWFSFCLAIPPCRSCFDAVELREWINAIELHHHDCASCGTFDSERLLSHIKREVGRPQSLSRTALARVLTLRQIGHGYRSTAGELRRAGIDVSWETVRRAVKRQGTYASNRVR